MLQYPVVTERSFSIALMVSVRTLSVKEPISSFHGFKNPLFMISVLDQEISLSIPVPKVYLYAEWPTGHLDIFNTDLQKVNITLRILYKPKVEMLPKIYTNLGLDFEERVLPSITYEVLKSVVAQFDASDLITQRELVSQRVNDMLTSRAANFGLTLDDISLVGRRFLGVASRVSVAIVGLRMFVVWMGVGVHDD